MTYSTKTLAISSFPSLPEVPWEGGLAPQNSRTRTKPNTRLVGFHLSISKKICLNPIQKGDKETLSNWMTKENPYKIKTLDTHPPLCYR